MSADLPPGGRDMDFGDGQRILYFDSVPSTMDVARSLARAGELYVGVRAGFQCAGRGRSGRTWEAPPGSCLLVTYLVDVGRDPAASGWLALAAGLAVADEIQAITGLEPGLKWPNDIMISNRKVAGILIETAHGPEREPVALVGIGLNVNVPEFPVPLDETATSLLIEIRTNGDLSTIESAIRTRLLAEAEAIRRKDVASIIPRWRARDVSTGRRYRVTIDGQEFECLADGIVDDGGLVLLTPAGERLTVYSAATVVAL